MDVAFAHNLPHMQSCDNFEGVFGVVQPEYGRVLHRFITVDETWIHHNIPETKQQSKQWVSPGKLVLKNEKVNLSANKVMATVFLGSVQNNPH